MSKHTISFDYLSKLERSKYWYASILPIATFVFVYSESNSLIFSIVFALGLGSIGYCISSRSAKRIVEWAKHHSAEIVDGKMVILDKGTTFTISLDVIEKIYLYKRRGKIISIVSEHSNGIKERLPQYSELERLVDEITDYRGKEVLVHKNWIHV